MLLAFDYLPVPENYSLYLLEPPLQKSEPFEQRKGQLADGFRIGPGQLNELRLAWMILLHSEELNL